MTSKAHPQVQNFLKVLAEMNLPKIETLSVAEARKQAEIGAARGREVFGRIELHSVSDTNTGQAYGNVGVRIYRPNADKVLPVLICIHGGGHVICSLDTHDLVCRNLAKEAECAVVSVDYRMGPEAPFPAAAPIHLSQRDFCFAALEGSAWVSRLDGDTCQPA